MKFCKGKLKRLNINLIIWWLSFYEHFCTRCGGSKIPLATPTSLRFAITHPLQSPLNWPMIGNDWFSGDVDLDDISRHGDDSDDVMSTMTLESEITFGNQWDLNTSGRSSMFGVRLSWFLFWNGVAAERMFHCLMKCLYWWVFLWINKKYSC